MKTKRTVKVGEIYKDKIFPGMSKKKVVKVTKDKVFIERKRYNSFENVSFDKERFIEENILVGHSRLRMYEIVTVRCAEGE